jgi:hypothetical protein
VVPGLVEKVSAPRQHHREVVVVHAEEFRRKGV